MTFTPALIAGNYTKLRSVAYAAAQHVSLCPNTTVIASTVNAVPATITIAQITLNAAPVGARIGHTVLVSKTDDRRAAFFRGRIRKTSAGNTIYINETSANILANDYVWIIDDYDLHHKLPVDDGTTYWKDFDEVFHLPNPILYNLPSSFAGLVDATGFLEIILAPLYILTNPDATVISTWFWEEDDGTYVVGNAATQNVTIKFPPGFRWIHVTATDDEGRPQIFHIQVHAHDDTIYPPELDFRGSEIENTVEAGWTANLGAFAGVSDVLDRTAVTIWSQEYYGAVEGNLYGVIGRVEFTGRLRSESNVGTGDETYSFLKEVSFPAEGVCTRLAALDALPLAIRNDATPTIWDELEDLTVWRAIAHYLDSMTTFCTIHSLSFDDITDTFLYPELGTSDSRVLDAINDLAQSINAAMEFGPDGQTQVIRAARYLSQAARNALTTLAAYGEQDLVDLNLDRDYTDPVGQIEADGGVYNTLADQVSVAFSFAPGHAQDEGGDKGSLSGQILITDTDLDTARAELNFRSGQHLVAVNPLDELSFVMPPGYHAFVASNGAYFTWTLGGTQNVRGLVYTTDNLWMLSALSFANDNETGARETSHTYQAIGAAAPSGDTYIPAATGEIVNPYNIIPFISPYPNVIPAPVVVPKKFEWPPINDWQTNGQSVVLATENNLWTCHGFLGNELLYTDITPSAGDEVKAFQFGGDGSRAYCLMFDGTNSYIYTTTNVKADPVVWTQGDTMAGEWHHIRLGSTIGEIYALRVSDAALTTITYNFIAGNGGWAAHPSGGQSAVYVPGVGWENGTGLDNIQILSPFHAAMFITRMEIDVTIALAGTADYEARVPGVGGAILQNPSGGGVALVFDPANVISGTTVWFNIDIGAGTYAGAITRIKLIGILV